MDWTCRRLSIAETLRLGRTLARERNRAGCLVPGLGLGRRDSYRYQSITPTRLVGLYPSGRLEDTRPARQI